MCKCNALSQPIPGNNYRLKVVDDSSYLNATFNYFSKEGKDWGSYLPTGYQDIYAYSVRLPGPLQLSGPAVRTIAFTVGLSGPKKGFHVLFVSCQRKKPKANQHIYRV